MSGAKTLMTPGLLKAMTGEHTTPCPACAFPMPKYVGRYPKTCPNCGTERNKDAGAKNQRE